MPTWKKVIVSGSNAHLTSITASQVPTTLNSNENVLVLGANGEIKQISPASLTGANTLSFVTMSVGGLGGSSGTLLADAAVDTLNISSSDANLTITAAQNGAVDTLTFDFADSPTFTNITASGNISSSGNLTVTGNSTIGGNETITGNLSVEGNTTLGNASSDTVTVNAQTVTLQNPLLSTANVGNILVLTSSNRIATQSIDTRVFGTTLISGTGTANQIAYFNATTGIVGDAGLTYDAANDNVTVAGDIAVNGGDITTSAGTANIFNTTATTLNIGGAATAMAIGNSNGTVTVAGNLSVNGNTTIGNAAADTASINAGRVNISNLTLGSSELAVLVTGSGGQVFTRQLAASAFSGGSGISGTLVANRVPFASDPNTLTDDINFTYNSGTDVLTINSSTFGQSVSVNQNLTVGGNATITGDLTVNGTTTTIDTTNLTVEDKFIVLAHGSGSISPIAEGGIIVEGSTADRGQAFIFNSGSIENVTGRWGLAADVHATSSNVTPTDFMVSVSQSSTAPSTAPTYGGSAGGYGNIYVNSSDESIWIFS